MSYVPHALGQRLHLLGCSGWRDQHTHFCVGGIHRTDQLQAHVVPHYGAGVLFTLDGDDLASVDFHFNIDATIGWTTTTTEHSESHTVKQYAHVQLQHTSVRLHLLTRLNTRVTRQSTGCTTWYKGGSQMIEEDGVETGQRTYVIEQKLSIAQVLLTHGLCKSRVKTAHGYDGWRESRMSAVNEQRSTSMMFA